MQSLPAVSQFEIGLDSMSSILSKISLGTTDGNSFLNIIEKDIFNMKNDIEMVLFKSLTYHSKSKDISTAILITTTQTNELLTDILTFLQNGVAIDNGRNRNENTWREKLYKTFLEQEQISIGDGGSSSSDNYLKSIEKNVSNIFKKLTGGKLDKDIDKKIIKTDKEKEKSGKSSEIFAGFAEFAQSLLLVKANLTSKLIGSVNKFGETYSKLVSNTSKRKTKVFGETMEKFSMIIDDLASDKKLKSATWLIGGLAVSFGLLSLATINPMFIAGIGVIAGFVFIMSKISNDKEMNPGMDKFGLGIAALVGALLLIQFVPGTAILKLIGFIGLLGLALRSFNGKGGVIGQDKGNQLALTYFAIGITALVLSMLMIQFVPWEAGAKMLVFIAGLGIALKFFSGPRGMGNSLTSNPMIGFGFGIGILTLALFAMSEVSFESIFKMVLFVGAIGLTMKLFNFDKVGPANSMVGFAFGMGLMVLAVLAIDEIDNMVLLKGVLFIGALGLVMKLYNFDKMGPKNSMISFAFGFGIMVLAMYAINELPWEALGKTLVFLGGLGLIMKLFKGTEGASFLMLAGGITLIAGALWIFKKANFTLIDALTFGGIVLGLSAIMVAIGIPVVAGLALTGALTMVAISAAALLSSLSLWAISNIKFNTDNILNFMLSAGILSVGFALLSITAGLGLVGAGLFIPIGIAALLGAAALWDINKLEIDNNKIGIFMDSVSNLITGFALIANPAALGVVGAVLFVPIAGSSLLGALVLALITKITIDLNKITIFGESVKKLVGVMNDLSGWDLVKTSAKSLLLLPILGSSLLAGVTLRLISGLNIDQGKIVTFGTTLGLFTTTIATVLSENEGKLKSAEPGMKALAKLMNVSSGIAKTIQMIANMQFYEYEVENGKLVLKGVRTLNSGDFKRVGENLGSMLECLINPLLILGSNQSTFEIGGKKIVNPFKSGTATKGIEMLSTLGNAFKPLAESVKTYASIPMVSNPVLMQTFSNSLVLLTKTFDYVFQHLSKFDNTLITSSISSIVKFNDAFKNSDVKQITNLNNIMEKFMNNLSDQSKWRKIQINLGVIKKQFGDIAKNINSIDINKAASFERNVKQLVTQNSGENLRQAVEALTELLGMVQTNQNTDSNSNGFGTNNDNTNPLTPGLSNAFGFKNEDKTQPTSKVNDTKNTSTFESEALTILSSIASALGITNSKLSNKLKVEIVGGNSNSI